MKPYYSDGSCTIYHGDAREVLPQLQPVDAVVTDPVWPNAIAELAGSDRPVELFAETAAFFPTLAERAVIHMGCDSDPRFLAGMPPSMPFFRACHLEYACPHYKGRLLYTHDVAYVFGTPPRSRKGAHVMPGKVYATDSRDKVRGHPCSRAPQHVRWLAQWFGGASIIDPFMGAGTTLITALSLGVDAVGIEIEERFCELAALRLEKEMVPLGI